MKACLLRLETSVQELSPERAALLLAVGLVLGVFPMIGVPTVLCLLAGLGLRLNLAALQLLNSFSSPVQLALVLPLERAGAVLFRGAQLTPHSLAAQIGIGTIYAIAGWVCMCLPAGALLYAVMLYGLRKSGKFPSGAIS